MKKEKEVGGSVAVVNQDNKSVDNFISQAIERSLPVETMEKLFALRERVKAEYAKEQFVQALANFQAACPVIKKTKKVMNKDGRTVRYLYAPIDTIVTQIKKPLADSGISYSWEVKNEQGFITAVVSVTHRAGHTENSDFKVPVAMSDFMTAPQSYASALTFAKRYSLCNALGISTGDDDTDAVDTKKEPEAKSVKSKIIFLLKALKEPVATKEQIEASVLKKTQLTLEDGNFDEIKNRLEVLVSDLNESSEV